MKITVLSNLPSSKYGGLKTALPPGTSIEILPIQGLKRALSKIDPGGIVYLDVRSIEESEIRKHTAVLASNEDVAWGILDPMGCITDVAALFFMGAKDYLGPTLLRQAIPPSRLDTVRAFAGVETQQPLAEAVQGFPGWSRIAEGAEIAVRFCYASVGDPDGLRENIGEKRLRRLREDFSTFMGSWAAECKGIAWMRDPEGVLLLFPNTDEGANPVLSAFRLILDRALVGYEVFNLEVPFTFRFAFHAGKTIWRRPGATGTIISGDVNFIFHLGAKFAADGRITLSQDTEASIPSTIHDLFVPIGDFEGRRILASRRFKD